MTAKDRNDDAPTRRGFLGRLWLWLGGLAVLEGEIQNIKVVLMFREYQQNQAQAYPSCQQQRHESSKHWYKSQKKQWVKQQEVGIRSCNCMIC